MSPNLEEKIGFDLIRQLLKKECLSSLGRVWADKFKCLFQENLIQVQLEQTHEYKQILEQNLLFPDHNFINNLEIIEKLRIEGTFLEADELFNLLLASQTIQQCLIFLLKNAEKFPFLARLSENITINPLIFRIIQAIIDENGQLRQNASPELDKIRRELHSYQHTLRKKLETMLKHAIQQGWIPEEAALTLRNGRMVIPLLTEHKRKIKGFVQDESDTGKTVYLEPAEALEMNNLIKELELRERREIIRIFREVSENLRPFAQELKFAHQFLGKIDFTRAKARVAILLNAQKVELSKNPILSLKNAYHPHLFLKKKNEVVPLKEIHLETQNRMLVISGPNAGGKSVVLKTVGLLQVMHQSGLLIPAHPDSKMGIFQFIFLSIGDEQSLENSLSTYSSHLTQMKDLVQKANEKTLFLVDEMGSGTEPTVGGALAEVILEELLHKKAVGIITTHYTNLKVFADTHPNVQNGSMRYDGQKLEPLFELEIGQPGSSFALEIAEKIGFSGNILQKARQKLGKSQVNFEKLIKDLQNEKNDLQQKNQESSRRNDQLQQTLTEYQTLKSYLDSEKRRILKEAKYEAQGLIKEANTQIENTIRAIKESQANQEKTREVRQQLEQFKEEKIEIIEEKPQEFSKIRPKIIEKDNSPIVEGSYIRVKKSAILAQVIQIQGNKLEINVGSLRSSVKWNEVEKITRKEFEENFPKDEYLYPKSNQKLDLTVKMQNFSPNLDIRGIRGEEVIKILDTFVNDALLLGMNELRIIHGKGDGILRPIVRTFLKSFSHIKSTEDEHADRGGAGVTIVKIG